MVYDWFNRTSETSAEAPPMDHAATSDSGAAEPTEQGSAEVPAGSTAAEAEPAADDALAWARAAYARLKAEQEAARQQPAPPQPQGSEEASTEAASTEAGVPEAGVSDSGVSETIASEPGVSEVIVSEPSVLRSDVPEPEPEPEPEPAPGLSLLELAAAQRAERQQAVIADEPPMAPATQEAPVLGAFDETFTWSAEVLAAQGKRADQISLEEIDWLSRLRRGLEKTRQGFVTQLLENLGDDPLTPEVLDDLETTLLQADVGVQATDQVLEALRRRLNTEVVDPAEGIRFLKEQLTDLLEQPIRTCANPLLAPQRGRLNVWLLVGVNGVGKTTTLGKLANLAVRSGYSCLIAAADTFRAAAVQQVQVWGERSGVSVIANPSSNADPAAVVYDAIGAAQAKGIELVLVDTAGRLQTKHNLMEELAKVRRIVDKLAPDAAVESLLVLDASQGQNGLRQAMAFASAAGLTGVVLTKLDGSARGGVALAVASEAGLPIRFIGAGEGIRDLRPFNSFEFVEALLAG